MKLFLTQSANVGDAKAYLLHEVFRAAAQKANVSIVETPAEADLVLVFGSVLPNNPDLVGKKVFIIGEAIAMISPEVTLANALANGADYIAPKSAVSFTGVSGVKNIVAVTACPTGVAHTFMSAEAIEAYAKKQGWNVKVETRGQVGAGNEITAEEVAAADLVFVAADIDVPLDKFKGKPMYRTSTGLALKKTEQEFDKAFKEAKIFDGGNNAESKEESREKKGVYKHLMTGVSHMLPLVVAGGLLIAISFMFSFNVIENTGILGGIIAGFLAGYVVKGLNVIIRLPASLTSLKPILILPLLGSMIVGLTMIYLINPPVAEIMKELSNWLTSMGEVNAIVLGAIIGAMMCIDMGGPVNKAAYTFSVGLIASQVYTPMAAAMAAGMVPPIGMTVATWIARNKFTVSQRDAGKASFVLGLCFISEGALPFVAADPIRVIISSVIGGAVAGAISMGLNITLQAPHGGLFVIPFVSEPLKYLGAIAIGALSTGVVYAIIKSKNNAE